MYHVKICQQTLRGFRKKSQVRTIAAVQRVIELPVVPVISSYSIMVPNRETSYYYPTTTDSSYSVVATPIFVTSRDEKQVYCWYNDDKTGATGTSRNNKLLQEQPATAQWYLNSSQEFCNLLYISIQ